MEIDYTYITEQTPKFGTSQRVLGVIRTNSPLVFPGLVRYDHLTVICSLAYIFQDVKERRKTDMATGRKHVIGEGYIIQVMWISQLLHILNEQIAPLFQKCLPLIKAPLTSPLIKHLCTIPNGRIRRGMTDDSQGRNWWTHARKSMSMMKVYDKNSKHRYGTKGWWENC